MRRSPDDKQVALCIYCPTLCMARCPVSRVTGNIVYSPWGKQSSSWRLANGLVPENAQSVLPLHMCLDCMACREGCDHGVDVAANLAASRIRVSRPREPRPGEPPPGPPDPERAWQMLRRAAPAWRRSEDCGALLVPGLEMLSEGCEGMLEALFRVLDLAGDKAVGVNRDSLLECGHLPYTCGEHDQAMKEAAAARKRWGRYSRLLFASPHCASFVKTQWPLAGLDRSKQATTLLEYVAAGLDFSSPGFFKKSVAYHDPCHLGRHLHLYQLPRDILSWATNSRPVELLGSRERGTCCGGGYPLSLHAPQVADDIARLLAGFFADSRADVLVTACARCATRMAAAIPGGRVMHILEVIAERRR